MASGNPDSKRKRVLRHDGLHLWLAPVQSIWSLDSTTGSLALGHTARRSAAASGAGPGLLRDDRNALAALHNLAWSWYGGVRRTARWTLRCCGLLPSFSSYDEDGGLATIAYPTIGRLVTNLSANGEVHQINTPITSVRYDNEAGQTTWATDWGELDIR